MSTGWLISCSIFLFRRRFFALRGAAFLPLMYADHGVGLVAGVLTYLAGGSVAARRDPPSPDYEVHEPEPPLN